MEKIRIGIVGYGNVGRGVEAAISQNEDMSLVAVFTRRAPEQVQTVSQVPVYGVKDLPAFTSKIDVLVLCGGSATDLPRQSPELASMFNTVDSFDTHARIPEYSAALQEAAAKNGKVAVFSAGWDPGLFSMLRVLTNAILPVGEDYTFWGTGVSQGHSDAIRRSKGVAAGVQYTVPVDEAVEAVRSGSAPKLTTREKHRRVCYVVAEEGADKDQIVHDIVTMPNYFDQYDTEVNFITLEELKRDHAEMPHGGFVFRNGRTASGYKHTVEFSLKLESNPEFTASVLVCCARAAARLNQEGKTGAFTMLDFPLAYLSPLSEAQLREKMV